MLRHSEHAPGYIRVHTPRPLIRPDGKNVKKALVAAATAVAIGFGLVGCGTPTSYDEGPYAKDKGPYANQPTAGSGHNNSPSTNATPETSTVNHGEKSCYKISGTFMGHADDNDKVKGQQDTLCRNTIGRAVTDRRFDGDTGKLEWTKSSTLPAPATTAPKSKSPSPTPSATKSTAPETPRQTRTVSPPKCTYKLVYNVRKKRYEQKLVCS